ncbi:alpha/beta fold hydrolase [Stackebrandtia nassauensis]
MYAAAGARFIDLPTYPFQRERFWLRDNVSAATPKPVPAVRAPAPPAAEPEAGTTGDLLTMVRTEAAAALGYASAEDVEADDDFQELGFDSLAAVELRERLVDATGLTLAEEVALEYPTPVALARYLAERLGGDTGGSVPEPVSGPGAGLAGLFVRACADGQIVEANDLTLRMAAFREKYSGVSASPPRATTLTKGTAEPVLVCFPSFAWKYSPYYYAKLAASFEGGQSVIAVDLPGFAGHEPLPSTLDDLIATLADAATRAAAGRRFALLGHSEGGRLASLVAEYLEDQGEHPEAVILLDTIEWVTDIDHNETLKALYRLLVEQVDTRQPTSDGEAWITARAQYLTFEFPTPRPKAPSLLMRATGRLPGWRNEDARSEVRWEHTAVDVAGDHFSMLAEHAPESARTVANWLSDSIGDQKA